MVEDFLKLIPISEIPSAVGRTANTNFTTIPFDILFCEPISSQIKVYGTESLLFPAVIHESGKISPFLTSRRSSFSVS